MTGSRNWPCYQRDRPRSPIRCHKTAKAQQGQNCSYPVIRYVWTGVKLHGALKINEIFAASAALPESKSGCCSRPSNDLVQVRVPIGSGSAATDAIKVSKIVTGSVALMTSSSSARFRSSSARSAASPHGLDEQALGLYESSAPNPRSRSSTVSLPSKSWTSSNRGGSTKIDRFLRGGTIRSPSQRSRR
jgi:hypothetical protein